MKFCETVGSVGQVRRTVVFCMMVSGNTQARVLELGKSNELKSVFASLIEMQTRTGDQWHLSKSMHWLERVITCRSYAPTLHQLVYLIRIASEVSPNGDMTGFFWEEATARHDGCRHYFLNKALPSNVQFDIDSDQVVFCRGDHKYALAIGMLPRLVVVMHFLMAALGYRVLREAAGAISGATFSQDHASTIANDLSAQLYDYLKENLPTAQAGRRVQSLLAHFQPLAGQDFDADAVDDDAVLLFWESQASNPSGNFRTFRSAFLACIDLYSILKTSDGSSDPSRYQLIGTNVAEGEVDVSNDDVAYMYDALEQRQDLIERLQEETGDRVKFLNNAEMATLEPLMHVASWPNQFALSVVRLAVIGLAQNVLTQAQRSSSGKAGLPDRLSTCFRSDYATARHEFGKVNQSIEKILMASMFVLQKFEKSAFMSIVALLATPEDLRRASAYLGGDNDALSLDDFSLASIPELEQRAKEAFRSVNRKGFKASDLNAHDECLLMAHEQGGQTLIAIRSTLAKFLFAVDELDIANDLSVRFEADKQRVISVFGQLYKDGEA